MDNPDSFEIPKHHLPSVEDQGALGASTAYALFHHLLMNEQLVIPSEEQILIYYNERTI